MTRNRQTVLKGCAIVVAALGIQYLASGASGNGAAAQDKRQSVPQMRSAQPVALNPAMIPGTPAYEHARLKRQIETLQKRVAALQRVIERMRRQTMDRLQSMRPAICRGETELFNPALNIRENCEPYMCNRVAGICRTTCNRTDDCARGYVCDTGKGNGKCVRAR